MLLEHGNVALVTGTSRGLGPHIARALAARSMNLVLTARSQQQLESLAAELGQRRVEVLTVPADLRSRADTDRLIAAAHARFGAIDLLVNNAGLAEGVRFEHRDDVEIDAMIDVNLRAPMELTRRLWPGMLARGRGHVVNVASLAGLMGSAHNEGYCATKHGLSGSPALRMSAQDAGSAVGASVLCPGFMDGDGQYEAMKRDFAVRAPSALGSSSVAALGPALIRAIEQNLPEVLLTPTPQRPGAGGPGARARVFEWIARVSGVNAIFRAVADQRLARRRAPELEVSALDRDQPGRTPASGLT